MNKRKYRRLCNPTYEPHGEEGFGREKGTRPKTYALIDPFSSREQRPFSLVRSPARPRDAEKGDGTTHRDNGGPSSTRSVYTPNNDASAVHTLWFNV